MTTLLPGYIQGAKRWQRIWDVNFSNEDNQTLPNPGSLTIQGVSFYFDSVSQNRDGALSIVAGSGIKFTPKNTTTPTALPGFLHYTAASLNENIFGNNPPLRCMLIIKSYSGSNNTDYIAGGFTNNSWLWAGSPAYLVSAGLTSDGSPGGYISYNGGTVDGVFSADTDLDGRKYVVVELPNGFFSVVSIIKYGTTDVFNNAKMALTTHNSGGILYWPNNTSYNPSSYALTNAQFFCGARAVTNNSTFYVERAILEAQIQ